MNLTQLIRYSNGELHYRGKEIGEGDIIMRSGPQQIVFGWSKLFSNNLLKEEIEKTAKVFERKVKEEMKKREEKGEPPVKWKIVYEYGGDTGIDCIKSYTGAYEFYAIRRDALRRVPVTNQFAFDFYK